MKAQRFSWEIDSVGLQEKGSCIISTGKGGWSVPSVRHTWESNPSSETAVSMRRNLFLPTLLAIQNMKVNNAKRNYKEQNHMLITVIITQSENYLER